MEEEKLKCFDVAYLEQITEELLHYKVEPKTIYRGVPIDDFISLVRRMREAQEELDVFEHGHDFFKYEVIMKRKELISKVIKLESEVDEYLEKFNENI